MDRNLEQVIITAIETLCDRPNMVKAVANKGYFITALDIGVKEPAVFIDMTRKLNPRMSFAQYQDISMGIHENFAYVRHWYRC